MKRVIFQLEIHGGHPPSQLPRKLSLKVQKKINLTRKKRKTRENNTTEKIINCIRIEDKVIQGEEIDMRNYKIEITDIKDWNDTRKSQRKNREKEKKELREK